MTRRIVLHIGSPKCGSTYLQQVMLQNAGALMAHGIRYPHSGEGHPGNAAGLMEIDRETLEHMFGDGVHTVVLSHEDLYSMPKRGDALAALARDMGIKVQLLAFLRPFSEFVFGDYSQFMKQHFDTYLAKRAPYDGRDFETFAMRRVQNLTPAAFLRNWSKRFSDLPIIVESHRNIRPVLEQLLGAEVPLDWEVDRSRTNPSLPMEDCDRIAAAMRDPAVPDSEIRAMFRRAFHHTGEPDAGKTLARIAWIEERFEAQNDMLEEQFGFDNRRAVPAG